VIFRILLFLELIVVDEGDVLMMMILLMMIY